MPDPRPRDDSSATLGLLPYLNQHALDEDYAAVAARGSERTPPGRLLSVVVVGAFVLLLVTAATQTSRNAVANQHERDDLISQVEAHKKTVDADIRRAARLRSDVANLQTRLNDSAKLSAGTRDQLDLWGLRAGTAAVRGAGVSVTVDDAVGSDNPRSRVLDTDLQQLVNGLWQAGAEAVAINDQRITTLTSIRQAGSAITVNYRSLDRPYVVDAIGNPATLPTRFADTASGATWLDLEQQVGLQFDLVTRTSLSLPAAPLPDLRFATAAKGGTS